MILSACSTASESPIGIRCIFRHQIQQDGQTRSETLEHIFPPDGAASESGVARQFSQTWHGYAIFVSWDPNELLVEMEDKSDDPTTGNTRGMTQSFDLTQKPDLLKQGGNVTGLISFRTGDVVQNFFSYSCSAFQ